MYMFTDMIPIYLLETFVLFGENTNLVKTAKVLNQTQPTTSRQIELLQNHFKRPLFKTVGRTKQLTEYGQQVQQYYKKSILEIRELQNKMGVIPLTNDKERLTLAGRSEFLEKYISNLSFKSCIEMISLTGSEARQRLQSGSVDIAILNENLEHHDYFRKKLFTSEWRIVYPENWKTKVPAKNLAPELWIQEAMPLPFASYDKDLTTLKNHFVKKSALPLLNIDVIAADWRLIQQAVQRQKCWSIVPEDFAKAEKVISISASSLIHTNTFFVYFLKSLTKNKDVGYLIEELKSQS